MRKLELRIPPLLLTACCAGLIISLHYFLPYLNFRTNVLFRIFAKTTMIIGFAGMACAALQFRWQNTTLDPRQPDKTRRMVCSGLFACSRNPMYLGMAVLLAGLALWGANLIGFFLLPGFVIYLNEFQIKPEERILLQMFGAPYMDYMTRVRRWL